MPILHQSATEAETAQIEERPKKKKKQETSKKNNKGESEISEESGSKNSLKQKINCYLFCCCYHGKST